MQPRASWQLKDLAGVPALPVLEGISKNWLALVKLPMNGSLLMDVRSHVQKRLWTIRDS
jgi:hypothetical protein